MIPTPNAKNKKRYTVVLTGKQLGTIEDALRLMDQYFSASTETGKEYRERTAAVRKALDKAREGDES